MAQPREPSNCPWFTCASSTQPRPTRPCKEEFGQLLSCGPLCLVESSHELTMSQAALSGTLNLPMRFDELSALSPVVRKEVLSGELKRRLKSYDLVSPAELDSVVEAIVGMSLSEVVQGIQQPTWLARLVDVAKSDPPPPAPSKSPSPSSTLDMTAPNATASAPDHPSTPISMPTTLSTPPRTESPSGSVPPTSEKERMAAAVAKLESNRIGELTDLLMSLPKRERAMCLFNVEVLRAKLADAKMVLDVDEDEEPPAKAEPPVTPQARKIAPMDASPPARIPAS